MNNLTKEELEHFLFNTLHSFMNGILNNWEKNKASIDQVMNHVIEEAPKEEAPSVRARKKKTEATQEPKVEPLTEEKKSEMRRASILQAMHPLLAHQSKSDVCELEYLQAASIWPVIQEGIKKVYDAQGWDDYPGFTLADEQVEILCKRVNYDEKKTKEVLKFTKKYRKSLSK